MNQSSEPAPAAPVESPPSLASRARHAARVQPWLRRVQIVADGVLVLGAAHVVYAAAACYSSYRRTERDSVWFAADPDHRWIDFAGERMTVADARWASSVQVLIAGAAPLALGIGLVSVSRWVRREPGKALAVASVGYVALLAADFLLPPQPLLGGGSWKTLCLATLVGGWRWTRDAGDRRAAS
jgi:hypothetical protein